MITAKPLTELQLPGYTVFTRDSFHAATGKAAPPADSTKRPKGWIGSGTFWFVRGLQLVQETVPPTENGVNIEGGGPYPANVLQATRASAGGKDGPPYNPLYLSLEADARALVDVLKGSNLRDEGATGPLPLYYPADEPRREWEFDLPNGVSGLNVGSLLYVRNLPGVGSGGHWNTATAVPTWVPDLHPMPADLNNPWSPPCRPLKPNEQIGRSGIMAIPMLLVSESDPGTGTTPAVAGGFTENDRRILRALADRFGIS